MSTSPPLSPERVLAHLDGIEARQVATADGIPTFVLERDALPDAWRALRDGAGFETVTFVTAVDRFPAEPRYEVSWQLLSLAHAERIRVRALVPSDDARVPSSVAVWPGAAFSERECWDMFGVRFDGHPDLRRLLMPEAYEHHPLRKDFPHHGIEPDKLYREWDAERRREWEAEEGRP